MQKKSDKITPNGDNLSLQASKGTYFWSKPELNQSGLYPDKSLNQLDTYLRFIFPTSNPDMQRTEKKEAKPDTGFSFDCNYQVSCGPKGKEKHPKGSPEMEKAVESLKRTFFSNSSDQNKSSNAKCRLLLPNNEKKPRRESLIDNLFSQRTKQTDQLASDESKNASGDYSKTVCTNIDSWLNRTSIADFDTRSEDTLTTVSDISHCKIQETTSTLENKMTFMLMDPENSKQTKYTKLKTHLLKERVLTCQLITQKTISDLRAKLAEQIVESEQEWKNKICLDMETTQTYLGKISSMFVDATNQVKKEVEKNEEMKKNLRDQKRKKKCWKLKQKVLQKDLDMKIQQIENKDEKIKQLQETISDLKNEAEELIQQFELEKQTKQKIILVNKKYEENMKRDHQKLEKLKEEQQTEKHLHRFTKNAYEALEEDWNVLFKNSLELHQALVHSIDELNKEESSANNKSSFTKC